MKSYFRNDKKMMSKDKMMKGASPPKSNQGTNPRQQKTIKHNLNNQSSPCLPPPNGGETEEA